MAVGLGWLLAAALGAWLALLLVAAWWRRHRASRRARRRSRRAVRAEVEAEALLARAGYEVMAVQPRCSWCVHVDGAPTAIEVRADLLVKRAGEWLVADVKTGAEATRITTAATRPAAARVPRRLRRRGRAPRRHGRQPHPARGVPAPRKDPVKVQFLSEPGLASSGPGRVRRPEAFRILCAVTPEVEGSGGGS